MDESRRLALAAQVVAWHNRHPLARRITAEQVQSLGRVALPFFSAEPAATDTAAWPPVVQPLAGEDLLPLQSVSGLAPETRPAASLRPPAQTLWPAAVAKLNGWAAGLRRRSPDQGASTAAGASRKGWKTAFSEEFIDLISNAQAARFALRHGVQETQHSPAEGPLREVLVDQHLAGPSSHVSMLQLATAAIEVGHRRRRVLFNPVPQADAPLAVLGSRLWSLPRVGGAGVAVAALMGVGSALLQPAPTAAVLAAASQAAAPRAEMAAVVGSSASVATPAALASAALAAAAAIPAPAALLQEAVVEQPPAPAPASVPAPAPEPAPAPALAASTAVPAALLLSPAVAAASTPLGLALPALDEAQKMAARDAVAQLRAVRAASAPQSTTVPQALVAQAAPTAASPLFALATRTLRTRAESEQMLAALKALLSGGASQPLRVEMLAAGDDWRVVCFPFKRREDAEQVRATLAARGLRLDALTF